MSTRTTSDKVDPVIETRADMIGVFAGGEKPPERWRIGTEHEKFVYRTSDHSAPSYDAPDGIRNLLMALTRYGWEPVMEGDNVIALSGADGAISLEPAGQLELSGAPLENLHQTCAETGRHLEQVKAVHDTVENLLVENPEVTAAEESAVQPARVSTPRAAVAASRRSASPRAS